VRTLDDFGLYLKTVTLDERLTDLKAHSLRCKQVGKLLGRGKRTLSGAARDVARNARADTLGALKLECVEALSATMSWSQLWPT